MTDEAPSPWMLLSVLFSTVPLSPALTRALFDSAYGLYRRDEGAGQVQVGAVRGRVENLKRELLLGSLGGPAFEATLDTERGAGTVRFFLTKQGLEYMAEREPRGAMN